MGKSLLARDGLWESASLTWGSGSSGSEDARTAEHGLESAVSRYIRAMSMLWVAVPGPGGKGNPRSDLEVNSIALLSNFDRPPIDLSSPDWLGRHSAHRAVRLSGLWNVHHVDKSHDTAFLDTLESLIAEPGA